MLLSIDVGVMRACQAVAPFEIAFSILTGTPGAIGFTGSPAQSIQGLRDALRAATLAAYAEAPVKNLGFHPHVAIAYANAPVCLRLTVVSKWYHRRAVMALHTRLPEAGPLHAIAWEPAYAGTLVTRENWSTIPDARRRVIREWQEVSRRLSHGTYLLAEKRDGTWQ